MKILMLTPRFPYPPTRGDAVRAWYEVETLARRHQIWLACVDQQPPTREQVEHVREICEDVAVCARSSAASLVRGGVSWLRGGSLTAGYFGDSRLRRIVARWAEEVGFDAVLTFGSAMAPYAELVPARRVLDMNDVDSWKWLTRARLAKWPLRTLYGLETIRLAADEQRWALSHDVNLLVNGREQRKLGKLAPTARTSVLRTPVDVTDFAVGPLTSRPIVGMVGSMFYEPNVKAVEWFGREVWPRIRAAREDAEWWIVGAKPVQRVRRWASQSGVRVTGTVPDVRGYLADFRVFVNPVHGDLGVQTKLLMALAAGCPAVVTPDVAAGIDYLEPAPFMIAADGANFADATLRLLRDDYAARTYSEAGRMVIDANYRLEPLMEELETWLAPPLDGTDQPTLAAAETA